MSRVFIYLLIFRRLTAQIKAIDTWWTSTERR